MTEDRHILSARHLIIFTNLKEKVKTMTGHVHAALQCMQDNMRWGKDTHCASKVIFGR